MQTTSKIALFTLSTVLVSCGANKAKQVVESVSNAVYSTVDEGYMDKAVRPQDDFFLYSNGTWVKNNPVPSSESRWGSFNELDEANKKKLNDILQSASQSVSPKGSQDQILGDYFTSYISIEERNKRGLEPINEELNTITAIKSKNEIPAVLAMMHSNGIRALFGFGVGQDLKNVDKNITSFFQGGLGLPNRDYYFSEDKSEILLRYQEHIVTTLVLAGKSNGLAEKMAEEVVEFEKNLAENMMRPAEMRIPEKTYNKLSKNEVSKMLGAFSFTEYLNKLGSLSFDTLIVGQPAFVNGLAKLTETKSLDSWKNYLSWKVLNHYAGHLSDPFIEANFAFYGGVLSGKKEMKQLEEQCIEEITRMNFGEWLGKAFVEKHFSESASKRVNTMVDNLLAVYGERINNLDWMSSTTKKEALKKLNAIGRKLGYPSTWEDYSTLDFNKDTYIENYRNSLKFAQKKNLSELALPVNKDEWGMPAHMVNAYYHPLLNEIAFPAGIMQPPFFDVNAEDAVNYGRIGMVIGHEFTHGFDDMGSKFAADGSFSNWWTDEDRAAFETKTGLLGETYAAFCPIEGQCVNPELTMGENIADLGGLTMAFYAYKRTPEFISGISRNGLNPAQRFFISYAQLWKINYTEAELKNRIANDPHSPGMYRVNGPLKNCPEFFEAFNVKEGDKMRNNKDKVARIW
ncbi:MAG: M13 family metallopeptidase [Bacteroidetes bacterium]|nr:M13 family metallopeptidase [Bacteroidota bacterium]